MNLRTQIAKEHDKKYFFDLYSDSMKTHIETLWGWDQDWQISDSEDRWNLSVNYILFNAEKRIGYFQVTEEKDGAYIMMFIIDEKFRSKGVGSHALTILRKLLLNKSLSLRVFKTNNRALSFYKANGFSIIEQEDKFYIMHQRVA
ncbi:N-acetyltransferase [Colwellia sp. MB3u-55]|uniref:GNAT family N-acetyltransferase n=1 Tax=Colwellia sp. MB3u-55 TaxID=2759810 RepID=UPI0015F567C8|nr:GNAT family N-acetyltransferase [Colwellia sp. MB3u-55]MBA6252070.1 GNAT family N-acetyltransferase [Colwellia sp. MB3u-55]